jgi:hypothetical protein
MLDPTMIAVQRIITLQNVQAVGSPLGNIGKASETSFGAGL